MDLNLTPNIRRPDDFYETLLQMHDGLDEAESHKLWARLVLLLANHIGDGPALSQALELAAKGQRTTERESSAPG